MILTEEDLIGGVQEVIGRFWTVAAVEDESEMVTISGHQDARRNDEKNLLKALAHQSLSVAIDASARDFQRLWSIWTMVLLQLGMDQARVQIISL
ncbi:unnamed protein product [Brassica rapa]|uniref:Uncharacterized protein n=1 Tax=Brassica campestris TaxID=3711 RepID=A0A8D9HKN3_BRACM|nr:unnamed protein product [Brassica rapa]